MALSNNTNGLFFALLWMIHQI